MHSKTNTKFRRNYDVMIRWIKEVLDQPESELTQKIRRDLILSVFKTAIVFFVAVICTIVFFHCCIYASLILDVILFVLGTIYSIYKGLFLGCLGVYDKYNSKIHCNRSNNKNLSN